MAEVRLDPGHLEHTIPGHAAQWSEHKQEAVPSPEFILRRGRISTQRMQEKTAVISLPLCLQSPLCMLYAEIWAQVPATSHGSAVVRSGSPVGTSAMLNSPRCQACCPLTRGREPADLPRAKEIPTRLGFHNLQAGLGWVTQWVILIFQKLLTS